MKPIKKKVAKKAVKIVAKKAVKKPVKKVLAIPKGYTCVTPYLIVDKADKAIAFYKKVFGAKEMMRMTRPDGKVGHAELKIGGAVVMLADECPKMQAYSPKKVGGSPVSIHLYTKEVDKVVARALSAGAKLVKPVEDMFWGDRAGGIQDPYGHSWCVSTHIEDVTPAQIRKRAAAIFST